MQTALKLEKKKKTPYQTISNLYKSPFYKNSVTFHILKPLSFFFSGEKQTLHPAKGAAEPSAGCSSGRETGHEQR